ncbi:MAG: sulfur carrier protein ThiS adenylyltransferase ThiF [bacterium]|nr:sulfur carrier protein ThiS adenylyltransferase ThiF [bacterium]
MHILLNEQPLGVSPGCTLEQLRREYAPEADVLIVNGAPAEPSYLLQEGDHVVLITRGVPPSPEEFEILMTARHTPGVHAIVKQSCVGIAGLGGLGSTVALALARMGVGRLILVDFDLVEPSNLNRQQYFIDQLGQPKAHALTATIARINPCVRCDPHVAKVTPDNLATLFAPVNVLIEAFDRADQKAMLAAHWLRQFPSVPLIMASGVAGTGPATTISVRRCGHHLYVVGDLESAAEPGRGLMAPRVGIAAHIQATLAVRVLLGDCTEPY